MLNAIKVNLSRQEIIGAVKSMKKKDREAFLEELLATSSPEYLKSIPRCLINKCYRRMVR
jgi:hypothetical protein